MSRKIIVKVPPISVNKCWQGRRFKSKVYKQWGLDVATMLISEKPFTEMKEWIVVDLEFYIKNFQRADADNMIKPILDSLTHAKVILDDRYIKRVSSEKWKVSSKEDERIIIKISKYAV